MILTIIIFTNSRYKYLVPLLNDIIQSNIKINIKVIDYGNNNKNKILFFLKNKNIKFIFNKKKLTFAERYYEYIKKVKTKYVWFIGDDDRIETAYLKLLVNFLKLKNKSGFALNLNSFEKDKKIKKNINIKKKIEYREYNLFKQINNLGTLGTQIINVNYFRKIDKSLNKKILLKYGYPQVYIALKLISVAKDWKFIKNKILFYRYGNFRINNKNLKDRLHMEYNGYFAAAKEIFSINSKIYKKIYRIIFFKNIFSWLILSIENCGKMKTRMLINNYRMLIPNCWWINFILYLIFITPVKFWKVSKKFKKFFKTQYSKYLSIIY